MKKDPRELVALLRAQPGRFSFASGGAGSPAHIAGELLKQRAGANLTHIPYKGGGQALTDVLGGNIPLVYTAIAGAIPHVKSGKVRALAVTTAKPSKAYPQLPTMTSMFPGFDVDNWYAMFVPAGTPKPIVDKLNAEIVKAIKLPDVNKTLTETLGMDVLALNPEATGKFLADAVQRWGKVVKDNNIRPE